MLSHWKTILGTTLCLFLPLVTSRTPTSLAERLTLVHWSAHEIIDAITGVTLPLMYALLLFFYQALSDDESKIHSNVFIFVFALVERSMVDISP